MNAIDEFDELWRTGDNAPDLFEFLKQYPDLSENDQVQLCLTDQHYHWQSNQPRNVQEYLERVPCFSSSTESRITLLVEEFGYQEEHQTGISPAAFAEKFRADRSQLLQELAEPEPSTTLTEMGPVELPSNIDRYEVTRELGRGTFGIVYLALDNELNRSVAIKIPYAASLPPEQVTRFRREAQVVAAMDHAAIVPVFDVGMTADGKPFVVSKYIDGQSLADVTKLATEQSVKLIRDVCYAIQHAHHLGIIHRDLKPANILIGTSGEPYVVDFGLFKIESDWRDQACLVGTPAYMSPEQARGESHRVDARSDIFSLGVVLYELTVGQKPWGSKTSEQILQEIQKDEFRSPRQRANIDRELERIILKAMSNRASQRYSTAQDMAEDLDQWLGEQGSIESSSGSSSSTKQDQPTEVEPIPRGLRSYSGEDASFFLELLPGPRDKLGLPDHVSFWINKINSIDPLHSIAVGLIYGPSGCGKSSLAKAAILPNAGDHVETIFVEARRQQTDRQIRDLILDKFPELTQQPNLTACLGQLRIRPQLSGGKKKVLIVIDQFEQWLNSWNGQTDDELILALRQCNGISVQALLMVRDDFWMAITRCMRCLDIPLVQYENTAGVDLFDTRHARKVLTLLGQSYGALPKDLSPAHERFVENAVDAIADDSKVIPVRLALLAEMIKNRPWCLDTLQKLGGISGIGVAFLEESFGAQAPPQYRFHHKAARQILESLLPASGSNIKGASRSRNQLQTVADMQSKDEDFDDLLRILDKDLRLITPADATAIESNHSNPTHLAYQLTHDYLVPSIRSWLNQNQRLSAVGRAKLRLRERSADWNQKPENRRLPSSFEFAATRLLTSPREWTPPQQSMMAAASKFHLQRLLLMIVVLAMIVVVVYESMGKFKARSLVSQLLAASSKEVADIVADMQDYRRWTEPVLLRRESESRLTSEKQVHVDLALVDTQPSRLKAIVNAIPGADPELFDLLVQDIDFGRTDAKTQLWEMLQSEGLSTLQRLNVAGALAAWDSENRSWKSCGKTVASLLLRSNITRLGTHTDRLESISRYLKPDLQRAFKSNDAEEKQKASILLSRFQKTDSEFIDLLMTADKHQLPPLIESIDPTSLSSFSDKIKQKLSLLEGEVPSTDRVVNSRQKANLLVALYRINQTKLFCEALSNTSDQLLRNHVMDRFTRCNFNPLAMTKLLPEANVELIRMMIQAIGMSGQTGLSGRQKDEVINALEHHYRNHPDAGVHASSSWALKRWSPHTEIPHAAAPGLTKAAPGWIEVKEVGTLVVLPTEITWYPLRTDEESGEQISTISEIYSPPFEDQHTSICTTEVSYSEFQQFAKTKGNLPTRAERFWGPLIKTSPDGPAVEVSWYAAAAFCNWMSKRHGIPKDQWCYQPNPDGAYADGMRIPRNVLQRTGFRLPTLSEIRTAVAAGNQKDLWFFGEDVKLSDGFAWHVFNSEKTAHPCAELRPNDWGFFDAVGNASEWCMTPVGFQRIAEEIGSSDLIINDEMKIFCTGGTYLLHEYFLRTQSKQSRHPHIDEHATGFRLARTLNRDELQQESTK